MNGLTKRQVEVLAFVQQFINNHHYSPSLNEIKAHFGFASINSAFKHLEALKRKGHLLAESHSHRSLALPKETQNNHCSSISLPLIGSISAGQPITTYAKIESIQLSYALTTPPENAYLLRVHDQSLQDEMLLKDDLIVIEVNPDPKPGKTIVATVNGHNTVIARYFSDFGHVKLLSHTSHHQPLILRSEDVAIQGVVIAAIREY